MDAEQLSHQRASPVAPTGLDKYQWGRPPQEPLDLLTESEQYAALVRIAQTLVEIFQKTGDGSPTFSGQVGAIPPSPEEVRSIVVTPTPAVIRFVVPPVQVVQGEQTPPGKPFGVPWQWPHFQERSEELDRLKTSLLKELNVAVGLTGKTTKFGVHGQGGIGKTVLPLPWPMTKMCDGPFQMGSTGSSWGRTPILSPYSWNG